MDRLLQDFLLVFVRHDNGMVILHILKYSQKLETAQ